MHYIYLFYKQPVYKQLVLERQIAKNVSVVRYVKYLLNQHYVNFQLSQKHNLGKF